MAEGTTPRGPPPIVAGTAEQPHAAETGLPPIMPDRNGRAVDRWGAAEDARDAGDSTPSGAGHVEPAAVKWPLGEIPVEIFQMICRNLPRESVQLMRLVCSEFDHMVSAHYFRSVVAPFRASLYGSPDNHSGARVARHPGSPDGSELRTVFHLFGEHIRAFALALELKEVDLAYPPPKLTQEIVKTSWGLYRWPLENYQRYRTLEAIEDQADETACMTRSFSKLVNLTELGLSCDAGLGFLTGPNLNKYGSKTLPPVFQDTRYLPSLPRALADEERKLDRGKSMRYMNLKRMMLDAGFSQEEIPAAIDLLLWCEGKEKKWVNRDDYEDDGTGLGNGYMCRGREPRQTRSETSESTPTPGQDFGGARVDFKEYRSHALEPLLLTAAQKEMLLEMSWAHDALVQSYVIAVTDNPQVFRNVTSLTIARIPASLLRSLARPSFWESLSAVSQFSLGVIPDWREVKKENGVICDRLLQPIEAMGPTYELLAECVAPRRQITKLHFEWICGGELANGTAQRNRYVLPAPFVSMDRQMVEPKIAIEDRELVLSLPHIRDLSLKNCYFSPQVLLHVVRTMAAASLTSLKLEAVSITGPPLTEVMPGYLAMNGERSAWWPWPLCCSTAAPGRPFLYGGVQQAAPLQPQNMLGIHAQWMAQNNMLPASFNHPNAAQWLAQQVAAGPAQQTGWALGFVPNLVPQPLGPPPPLTDAVWQGPLRSPWVPVPRMLSWAHILDEITPDQTLLERYKGSPIEGADEMAFQKLAYMTKQFVGSPAGGEKIRLQNVEFKSCGYVLVDSPTVNCHDIIPSTQRMVAMPNSMMETLRGLDTYMLKTSHHLLGKVMDDMDDAEQHILRHAFGMYFGWKGVYDPSVQHAAHDDGFLEQGRGRFTGGWRNGKPLPEMQSLLGVTETDGVSLPDN